MQLSGQRCLNKMKRLNPEKLTVKYLHKTTPENLIVPRRYTLTHSDRTGNLFLSIGSDYDPKPLSNFYTKFMRDEVLGEITNESGQLISKVYCHVSGGFVLGTAKWRYNIFQSELPLVLEVIRYGDRILFENNDHLDTIPIRIYFHSTNEGFNKIEDWGVLANYR